MAGGFAGWGWAASAAIGGGGWLRLGRFGLLHPGCLQIAENLIRALVRAVEAGFASGGESHRAGVVGLCGVGLGELDAVSNREFPFKLLLLAHLGVETSLSMDWRRRIRQRAATIWSTRSFSAGVAGWWISIWFK